MRISKETQQAVARAFNMENFGTGFHNVKDGEGNLISTFHVHSMWVAGIDTSLIRDITIAVIYSSGLENYAGIHKGVLLLPSYSRYQTASSETLKTVDITWDDPVTEALKNLNFMCESWGVWDVPVRSYSLHVGVSHNWIEINHYGLTDDPSRVALWKGLLDMIEKLKQAYNDERINEVLKWNLDPF